MSLLPNFRLDRFVVLVTLGLALAATGCDAAASAAPDAALPDVGVPLDGRVTADAAGTTDGGVDAGTDAAPSAAPDGGVPLDAFVLVTDDAATIDAATIDAATLPPPDAASLPDDAGVRCPSPGALETVACGMCGTMERFCTAMGAWSDGPCMGETGVCMPGTLGTAPCGNCGTQPARCTTSCQWSPTGTCTGEGLCAPGATMRSSAGCAAGESRTYTCDATCTFAPSSACATDGCTPGTLDRVPCGMCGMQDRFCNATHTYEYGACTGEGACMPGTTGTAACGMCGTATTLCNASCSWVTSGTCGGQGLCAAGTTSSCTTTCGSIGTQVCSATCAPGACTPPAEICGNGLDDDCNGIVDDGCAPVCGTSCAGAVAVPTGGGRLSVPLTTTAQRGSCGGLGAEGILTFTLTTTSDVFVTTHGTSVDTVLYARSCNCAGPEIGCDDDADGQRSSVLHLDALAPGTYDVFVDTFLASTGVGTSIPVDVYITPTAPAGDRCGRAVAIPPGTTTLNGNTCSLHADYDAALDTASCTMAAVGDGQDAVYYFYVPTTRTVTLSACGSGNDYDGVLYVRSVCSGAALANQRGCNDDGCSVFGHSPTLSVSLPAGLYYAFVDGFGGASQCGNYALSVSGI